MSCLVFHWCLGQQYIYPANNLFQWPRINPSKLPKETTATNINKLNSTFGQKKVSLGTEQKVRMPAASHEKEAYTHYLSHLWKGHPLGCSSTMTSHLAQVMKLEVMNVVHAQCICNDSLICNSNLPTLLLECISD